MDVSEFYISNHCLDRIRERSILLDSLFLAIEKGEKRNAYNGNFLFILGATNVIVDLKRKYIVTCWRSFKTGKKVEK